MRILISILALTSAFFVSAQTYDPSDLVDPYKEPVTTYDCQIGSSTYSSATGLQDCYQSNIDAFLSLYPSPSQCPSAYVLEESYSTNVVNFQFQTFKYTYKCFSSGIQAKEIIKTKELGARILADNCGQDFERVMKDFDRDYWMGAEESLAYGIVDGVLE